MHIIVDGLGNPLRMRLAAGRESDIGHAVELVDGFAIEYLIADRGYAAQHFYEWLVEREMEPVIPPHQSAKGDKAERQYDRWWYRERHLIGCFINKIKHFRRVFSWFDKLAGRYLGFLLFASVLVWLR